MLKPPHAFGIVQQGLYRSNAPVDENLPFLTGLNLKTVLYLSPEVLLRSVVEFFKEQNVDLHNLGVQAWRPDPQWTPICDDFIKDALEMVLDHRKHPLLICCTSGQCVLHVARFSTTDSQLTQVCFKQLPWWAALEGCRIGVSRLFSTSTGRLLG